MNKKSRRKNNSNTIIDLYTKEEKYTEIAKLVAKLEMLGLGVYEEQMKKLDEMSQKYMNENTEFREIIPLSGSKRIMNIRFLNNKKHAISINLMFDKNT